jgi:hypothetical protein
MTLSVLLTEFECRNENGGGVPLGAGARRLRPIPVLEAVDAMYFLDSIGHALRGVLPLAAVAAASSPFCLCFRLPEGSVNSRARRPD